jgi:hypothetical protein
MTPEWTIGNLLIQAIGGFLGAHAAALAAHEHRFGFAGHGLVGFVAGALSGFFFQRIAMTTVYGTGDAIPLTPLDAGFYQAVTGLVAGGIAMLVVGLLRYELTKTSDE